MRAGVSLPEVILVLALFAVTAATAVPRFTLLRDALAVEAASSDVSSALSLARSSAWERSRVVTVVFDTAGSAVTIVHRRDTVTHRPLAELHGIVLRVTRDTVTYAPNAMGYGASNTRIIVSRGAAAETLFVSRLGRVRR